MTPYEFGRMAGAPEKAAGLFQGLARAGMTGARALSKLNAGSKNIVQGVGGAISGLGGGVDAVGEGIRSIGRAGMSAGARAIRPVNKGAYSGALRDVVGATGHSARLGGKLTRGVGRGVSWLGQGIDEVGKGVSGLSEASMGIPTLAAGGLLAAGANIAPKLPLPSVSMRNPLDVNFGVKLRPPVEVNWPNSSSSAASSSASSGSDPYGGGW